MIGFIRGNLLSYTEGMCLIETSGGVGYEIHATQVTIGELIKESTSVQLYIATIVREDALLLFGFLTQELKQMFLLLTSISKVGSRTALAVLELFSVPDIYNLVAQNDIYQLSTVPGIGKKTAQHILLELQYKLRSTRIIEVSPQEKNILSDSTYGEAKEALLALGYEDTLVHTTLSDIISNQPTIELASLVRKALSSLSS